MVKIFYRQLGSTDCSNPREVPVKNSFWMNAITHFFQPPAYVFFILLDFWGHRFAAFQKTAEIDFELRGRHVGKPHRHYVVIALLSAVSSARMRPSIIFVIPCGSRSVFSKPSLRHSLFLIGALCTLWKKNMCSSYDRKAFITIRVEANILVTRFF